MKHYIFYYQNPETNELLFNIESVGNKLIVNYGENVTVEESAKKFFDFLVDLFAQYESKSNVKIIPKSQILAELENE